MTYGSQGRRSILSCMEPSREEAAAGLTGLVLVGKVLAIIVGSDLLVERTVEPLLRELAELQRLLVVTVALTGIAGSVLWVLVVRPLRRMVEAERQATAAREAQLRAEGQRQDFDARLHRALEMAATEDASYGIVRRTLQPGAAPAPGRAAAGRLQRRPPQARGRGRAGRHRAGLRGRVPARLPGHPPRPDAGLRQQRGAGRMPLAAGPTLRALFGHLRARQRGRQVDRRPARHRTAGAAA